ncbi:MAG: hypothetical protein EOP39_02575 [Rubrivivax sp.]|nr:MAG: hypothetical protein EOP39_02575 [Rubrivivax sp.]
MRRRRRRLRLRLCRHRPLRFFHRPRRLPPCRWWQRRRSQPRVPCGPAPAPSHAPVVRDWCWSGRRCSSARHPCAPQRRRKRK